MEDYSYLDKKYFIDDTVYNCPFCNRNNVPYIIRNSFSFNWTTNKRCYVFIARCSYCGNDSMHSSFESMTKYLGTNHYAISAEFKDKIDENVFHSQPTSFFTLDNRIPRIIRELITEAEGCLKMNFLTGASACMRKTIYELLVKEKTEGTDYESKIKSLKKKYTTIDPIYFDILAVCVDILCGEFYAHQQNTAPKSRPSEYEIYVPPQYDGV